jgi:hypothetical protein
VWGLLADGVKWFALAGCLVSGPLLALILAAMFAS